MTTRYVTDRRYDLSSHVVEVFNGLRGEAREKAIATGHYDQLVKQPQREPGEDDEALEAAAEAERSIAEECEP